MNIKHLKFLAIFLFAAALFFIVNSASANFSRDYNWGSGDGGDWARVTYDLSTELTSAGYLKIGGNAQTRGEYFTDSNGDGRVDQFSFERYAMFERSAVGYLVCSYDNKSGLSCGGCGGEQPKGGCTWQGDYEGGCRECSYTLTEPGAWSASYRITGVVVAPSTPGGLSAGLSANCQINLSWSDLRNEDGYDIERSTDGVNFGGVASPGLNSTSWTDGGVGNNTTYFYRIRARNAAGASAYSGSVSAVINFCRTYSMGRGGGEWSWGSFNIGAELMSSGYSVNILSISNGGEISNHGLADTNGNGYLDAFSFEEKNMEWRAECQKLLCWYYKYPRSFDVRFNVTGIEASIPSAPANLSASLSCPNVNLSWQDTSANEASFRVERAPAGSGAFGTLATLGANATSYQDANVSDGNYDYRVFANNSFGDSAPSNTANIAVACNQPPAGSPNAVSSAYFCSAPLRPQLSWAFNDPNPGDSQSAYQVQIDNNGDFSSPAVDSGKAASSNNFYVPPSGALNYGTIYYWRLMVWDSKDAASGWANGPQFTSQPHLCPAVDFNWSPSKPSVGEKVKFTESVTFYGGAVLAARNWNIPDAERYAPPQGKIKTIFSKIFGWLVKNIFAISMGDQNPEIIFRTAGSKSVQLQITDSDGLTNSATKTVDVNVALPKWKEIK